MFGFSFKDRVKKILESHFSYEPTGAVGSVLDDICAEAKRTGANEVSAAIMTMLVAMNMLEPSGDPAFDEKIAGFVEHFTPLVLELVGQSNQSSKEVLEMLEQIREKHGLTSSDGSMPGDLAGDILKVCAPFAGVMNVSFALTGGAPAFEITEFQKKFVLLLHMWGAVDYLMQARESSDESLFFLVLGVVAEREPIDFEEEQVNSALDLCGEIQEEAWAQEIIRGGGLAIQELLEEKGTGMGLGDVFANKGMLKKVALRIPASL